MFGLLSSLIFADYIRSVTILLSAIVCAFMPVSVGFHGRPWRVWALLICLEGYVFSSMVAMGEHYGQPLSWYRTPILFPVSVAGVVYIVASFRSWQKKGSQKNGGHK